MNELAERLTRIERVEDDPSSGPLVRPRDAATIVILDRSTKDPRVLVGKRNEKSAFLPGKFVFPGGRMDKTDRKMFSVGKVEATSLRRLGKRVVRPSQHRPRSLVLTAIREACEETGYLIGRRMKRGEKPGRYPKDWQPFVDNGVVPDLSMVTFAARAITPPGRSRRFDTRFFFVDKKNIVMRCTDPCGPDAELVELKWIKLSEAKNDPNMPTISKVVLIELEKRLKSRANLPVPFYFFRKGRGFTRVEIP